MSRIISPTTNTNPALVGEWYQQYTAETPTTTVAGANGTVQPQPTAAPSALVGEPAAATSAPKVPAYIANYHARFPAATPAPTAAPTGPVQSYTPEQYKATDWNVDANQLVETGVNRIVDADGPMMDRARAAGDAQSNARGLVNSSMGVQASQNAVYDHALAIATPDAMTYRTAAQFNASERNQAAFNNAQAVNRAREFGANAANAYGIAELGASTQLQVAGIGAAASRYGTDVGAKTELQRAQIAADSAKYNTDVGALTALQQSQISAQSSKTVAEIQRDSSWATANLSAETQRAIAELNTGSAQLVATINADTNKYISSMDNATKLEVQKFANDNQLLINTNQQAASAFNQAMAAISTIQNNASMDAATKAEAIRGIFATVNSQYETLSAVSGLEIPALLDFTGAADEETTADPTAGTATGGSGYSPAAQTENAGNPGP
jgi:hypothetical protein